MLCIPIQAPTTSEVITKMHVAKDEADLFEIWLDQVAHLNIFKIIKAKPKPLIFVNKPVRERGKWMGSEESRVELLKQAIDLGADYVDIGFDTNKKLIRDLIKLNRGRAKIIISYHHFTAIPETEELIDIAKRAYKLGANIVKIATHAKKYRDNLTMFDLVQYFVSRKKSIIGLCMGHRGKISRVVTPLLGSYLMYAPVEEGEETAAGQLTVRELKEIWQLLK